MNGTSLLGGCLLNAGSTAEAEPLIVESYRGLLEVAGLDHAHTLRARARLARLYADTGRPNLAIRAESPSGF